MKKVLLFGATGKLGKEIAKELVDHQYDLTSVVRSESKAAQLSQTSSSYVIADVTKPETLKGICIGQEIVISAMGKSVSLNDHGRSSFMDVDYSGNTNILEQAVKSKVSKFVYVSAYHAEQYPHLAYFKSHHEFSEKLINSGIDYSIIKPPAIFSAFIDLIDMARKGYLMNIGKGDKKTNPVYEGDLAKICVDAITQPNVIIEAGGKNIYTRRELIAIIQKEVNPDCRIINLPMSMVKTMLPIMKAVNKNMYDKFSFYIEVMREDTIAPLVGEMKFDDYIRQIHRHNHKL